MNCENCCEPIWNFVSVKKIAKQIYEYIKLSYGKKVALRWYRNFSKKIEDKNLCPWCVGFLANISLRSVTGSGDKFIEKWFIKNWEGL